MDQDEKNSAALSKFFESGFIDATSCKVPGFCNRVMAHDHFWVTNNVGAATLKLAGVGLQGIAVC
jgi:hypothetical protein